MTAWSYLCFSVTSLFTYYMCVWVCVCVCKCLCGSVGTFTLFGRIWLFCAFGHSSWQSGHKVLSVVRVQNMAHAAAFLFITHALAHCLSSTSEGCKGQTNLINIHFWNAFQSWRNLGDVWFNLLGTQRALTSQGIGGLVTSPLYFHFERVRYWFIMHCPIESCRN